MIKWFKNLFTAQDEDKKEDISSDVNSTPTSVPRWPSWYSGSFTVAGLTDEEYKEYFDLAKEHNEHLKHLKIEKFKSLDAATRQKAVDVIEWLKIAQEIGAIQAEKSARLNELENKAKWASSSYGYGDAEKAQHPSIATPHGLCDDDIIKAHMDVTMEETIDE